MGHNAAPGNRAPCFLAFFAAGTSALSRMLLCSSLCRSHLTAENTPACEKYIKYLAPVNYHLFNHLNLTKSHPPCPPSAQPAPANLPPKASTTSKTPSSNSPTR